MNLWDTFTKINKKYQNIPGAELRQQADNSILFQLNNAEGIGAMKICQLFPGMLADYAGITTPVILLLNMMDVANEQGKNIRADKIAERLGIYVIPFNASNIKNYSVFYDALENALQFPRALKAESLTELYREMPGVPYEQFYNLMPVEGIGAYSPTWLTAKLVEGDVLVTATVRETLDSKKLCLIFSDIE